jgi:flagellar hook protein FlgE
MSYYFIHDLPGSATNPGGDPNQWGVFAYVDGVEVDVDGGTPVTHPSAGVPLVQNMGTLNFNPDGSLLSNTPAPLQTTGIALTNGANPLAITHDFANNSTTQFSADFSVNTLDSDGFTTGRLTGLEISDEGIIRAIFSNGISTPLGQIALADFPNAQGLKNIGSASWTETIDSGAVIAGLAGTGSLGQITSGALETANVDLTSQLVNLITAQRNFQANARSIETTNAITDTIIQIR